MQHQKKERVDVLLVERGLADSREKAKRLIMAGLIFADQQRIDKPGIRIPLDSCLIIRGNENPYVSRGGLKLEKALNRFSVTVKDRIWMDVGASTGGFTHCLLCNGARKVYAIDVGYGQLDWKLRQDPRVVAMEKTNIRYLKKSDLKDIPEGAVIDVSFISLTLVLPVVIDLLNEKSTIIALVKPQFEVGKGKVGKKGVVRDANLHIEVLESLTEFIKTLCLEFRGLDFSPITGPEGNIEFLMHIEKGEYVNESKCIPAIKDIVYEAHKFFKDK